MRKISQNSFYAPKLLQIKVELVYILFLFGGEHRSLAKFYDSKRNRALHEKPDILKDIYYSACRKQILLKVLSDAYLR